MDNNIGTSVQYNKGILQKIFYKDMLQNKSEEVSNPSASDCPSDSIMDATIAVSYIVSLFVNGSQALDC